MKWSLSVVVLALVFMSTVYALSCSYDSTPNVKSDLRLRCMSNVTVNSRCYAVVNNTVNGMIVAAYPQGTFDYDRERYYVPDSSGVFAVTAPLGGEYEVRTNYTFNVTCFNITSYDTATYTIYTDLMRPPNFIGETGEWMVVNGRYLVFGVIILFLIVAVIYFIVRKR